MRAIMWASPLRPWQRLKADDFSYLDVAEAFIAMDKMMSGGVSARGGRELCLAGDWTRDRRPAPQAAGPAQSFLLGTHVVPEFGKQHPKWLTANGRSRRDW